MAYIGKQPLVGNYISCDSLSASATTTYNLASSGTPVFPTVPQNCIVSLNGVVQAPVTSFTISGSAIVFSTALSTTDSIDYITVLGNTLNIGTPSNNTVGLSQLSATGTPSTGTFLRGDNSWAAAGLAWQSVQTTSFTAVAARAYPVNTTSAGITVTLPASPTAGDQVQIVDYAGTADTNPIVINPNSNKLESGTSNLQLGGEREGVILTYIDATQGWIPTSGINEGTDALGPVVYSVDFLVIAGGGGGGGSSNDGGSGGGGAGGYRNSYSTEPSGGGGSSEASLSFSPGTVYTITVGAGGAATATPFGRGSNGVDSSISGLDITTITSAGGGGGGARGGNSDGIAGGSGGGGAITASSTGSGTGGAGTANQGFRGGNNTSPSNAGGAGGGGAGVIGTDINGTQDGATGGNGLASSITGSSVSRGGGGGGGSGSAPNSGGAGGTGGGGTGGSLNPNTNAVAGTVNTGGGGGGSGNGNPSAASAGGKGVVILRMPTAKYSGISTGSPTTTTSGVDTILIFNDSGSYTG